MAIHATSTDRRAFLNGIMLASGGIMVAGPLAAAPMDTVQRQWQANLADYQAKCAYAENVDNGDAALDAHWQAFKQLVF